MKKIANLQFAVKTTMDSRGPATTAELIKLTLGQPPERGFGFAEMRARNKVADAIDKSSPDEITLEDAEFETAKACVEAYRWGATHPDILRFAEQFGL